MLRGCTTVQLRMLSSSSLAALIWAIFLVIFHRLCACCCRDCGRSISFGGALGGGGGTGRGTLCDFVHVPCSWLLHYQVIVSAVESDTQLTPTLHAVRRAVCGLTCFSPFGVVLGLERVNYVFCDFLTVFHPPAGMDGIT